MIPRESCPRRFAHWGVDLLCKVLWARCTCMAPHVWRSCLLCLVSLNEFTCRECCSTYGVDGFLRACRLWIIIAITTNKASLYNIRLSFNRYLASFVPAYQKWAPKGEQASLAGRPPTLHRLLSPWALPRDDLRRRQCRHTSGPQHSTGTLHAYAGNGVNNLLIIDPKPRGSKVARKAFARAEGLVKSWTLYLTVPYGIISIVKWCLCPDQYP